MKTTLSTLVLLLALIAHSQAQTVWFDDFESYPAGVPPTNQSTWFISGGAGSMVLVSTNVSYDKKSSLQLNVTTNSVLLISTATARAAMWRLCSNGTPVLERISWSVFTTNSNVDAMYLQVRNGNGALFCGVGLAASGNFQYKSISGGWVDTGVPYATNVWHRMVLTLNYPAKKFSLYEKASPVVTNQPFATNQTTSFIPASVYVQGPVNNAGSSYVDALKAEFLEDGSGLQNIINLNAPLGTCALASNCTYSLNYPLVLPGNFTLNGNGSTLRMAPYSQYTLLVNSNWSGNSNITVTNLTLDGNAYDQSINPSYNATTRYSATSLNKLDNQGAYFKGVDSLSLSHVIFVDIPNEGLMLISDSAATVADCLFTNCALLTMSNNMSQAAVYTRWTTNSYIINNQFYNCFEGGIANGTGSDYNYIAGNYSTNSAGGEGVFLGQSSYCSAVGNTILNSSYLGDPLNFPPSNQKYWGSGAGIACDGIGQASTQTSNTICYNYIWSIGSAGITSASAVGTQIFGNQIYAANCLNQASPSGAISLSGSTNVFVYDNIVSSNNCSAVGVAASKNCIITNNLICPGNTLNAVYVASSVGIDTNSNYTEAASNPSNSVAPIIVDNTNSTGVVITGTWVFSTSTPGYYGNGYLHDNNTGGTGGKSVQLNPSLSLGGTYAVFLNWASAGNRASNTPVDVVYNGHTNTYSLNQQTNGGRWNWLGNFNFASGSAGGVVVRNDGANGYVIADAAAFALLVPQPAVPGQLAAEAGNQRVDLTWQSVPTASRYNIKRSLTSGGSFTLIGTAALSCFTDGTPTNGSTYFYKVSAVNSGGESDDTAAVSATPSCGTIIPGGLLPAASSGNNQVSLKWNAPSGAAASQVASFNVKRSNAISGPFTTITNVGNASYIDNGVSAGTVYYYVVSAVNPCGVEGANSTVVAAMAGIVVDNSDNSAVNITGSWTANTSPGDYGANYLHDGNAGGGKAVRFTPSLPLTGAYDVYVWWVANSNRATNAPVDVIFSGGTNTLPVDQTQNSSRWNFLSSFAFNAGAAGNVSIRDDGASGYVIADAVQWVWNTNSLTMGSHSVTQPPNSASGDLRLNVTQVDGQLYITWPTQATGYLLQCAPSLSLPASWGNVMTITNACNSIMLPMTNAMMFYRLSAQ